MERRTDLNEELKILEFVSRNHFKHLGLDSYQKDLYWRLETNPLNTVLKSRKLGISFFYGGFAALKSMRGKKVGIISQSESQANRVGQFMDDWIAGLKQYIPNVDKMIVEHNKSHLLWSHNGEVSIMPNSSASVRSAEFDYLLLDEWAHFLHGTDKRIWEAILPSLGLSEKLSVCANSTPWGEGNLFDYMYHDRKQYPDFVPVFYHYSECPRLMKNINLIKRNMDSLSFQQEFEGCLTPSCPVITKEGIIPIASIKAGSEVLTHMGRFKRVLRTSERQYKGQIIEITTRYGTEKIRLTPEHPVLALKHAGYAHRRRYRYFKPPNVKWYRASELDEMCFVFLPRLKISLTPLKAIKISEYVDMERKKNKLTGAIPSKNDFHKSDIIELDEDFATLLGYFVSEGSPSAGMRATQFSFNGDEDEFINEVASILKRKFGLSTRIYQNAYDRGKGIIVNSSILTELLVVLCSNGAKNKKVPSWIFNTDEKFIRAFIKAYWNGDGCYPSEKTSFWAANTVSKTLAYQIRDLLGMLGIKASVNFGKSKEGHIGQRIIPSSQSYCIRYSKNALSRKTNERFPEWFLFPVIACQRLEYDGFVHNLEVEDDNSFTTSKFTVHNCFIGDINTYFPYSLTRDIINQEIEYAVDLSKITVPLFGFADIGRRRDFTAIVLLANINDKLRLVYKKVLKTQEEKEWNNQYVEFRKVLSAPTLVRFGIDNGFGQQLVETMCREKPSVVVPFTFTNDNKNEMFPLARKRMETKGIEMPEDVELINSLHLIQRTQSGNSVSYGSDKHTDEYGHADLAVALIGAIYLFERDGKPRALPRTIDSRPTRFGYANPKRVKR